MLLTDSETCCIVFCDLTQQTSFGFGDGASTNALRGMGRGMAKNGLFLYHSFYNLFLFQCAS